MSVLLCLVSVLVAGNTLPWSEAFLRLLDKEYFFPNHSYVDFNLVGRALVCRSDLETCCEENQTHTGDWYFPNGERLSNDSEFSDVYVVRAKRNVEMHRRNNATTVRAGIYRCEIETSAANGDSREILYAGLYSSGG